MIIIPDCPGLVLPTNGAMNSTNVKQGAKVGVECDTGYVLFGATLLTCQSNATCDNPVPECRQGKNSQMAVFIFIYTTESSLCAEQLKLLPLYVVDNPLHYRPSKLDRLQLGGPIVSTVILTMLVMVV